jgi:hypothetical protein
MIRLPFFFPFVDVGTIAQVLAVPLLVVSSNGIVPVNSAVEGKPEIVVKMVKMKKGPCRASLYRQKAVEVSNLFRQALGLPLIKSGSHHTIKVLPFVGTPNTIASINDKDDEGNTSPHGHHHHGYHTHGRHRHHKGHHHFGKGSFINRIHYSIMNLGRWEGRAVAFVLGKIF